MNFLLFLPNICLVSVWLVENKQNTNQNLYQTINELRKTIPHTNIVNILENYYENSYDIDSTIQAT